MNDKNDIAIHLVDDDEQLVKSLKRLLSIRGYKVESFNSGVDFVSSYESGRRGIVILDIAMPEMDGLAIQRVLREHNVAMPIIFLSGMEDVEVAVQTMKSGAADFLVKPVRLPDLFAAIDRAMALETKAFNERMHQVVARGLVEKLTPRESEVLVRVIAGNLNKEIAIDLGTGEKTIKLHRGRMMRKLSIRSVADLVRLAQHAGIEPYRCECSRDKPAWVESGIEFRVSQVDNAKSGLRNGPERIL